MPLHCKKYFSEAAYTLVEMLAAIALVGILAVLLVPTAKGILERAAISKSANNLRQIGVAVSGYVVDNNGALPSKKFEDEEQNWIVDAYQRFYGKKWPGFVPWETGENLRGTIFLSPVLKSTEPKPWRAYGWNGRLQTGGETPPRMAMISNPAGAILCGDAQSVSNIDHTKIAYRNGGKALMLMADFHVQPFAPAEIPANVTDPMWRPFP